MKFSIGDHVKHAFVSNASDGIIRRYFPDTNTYEVEWLGWVDRLSGGKKTNVICFDPSDNLVLLKKSKEEESISEEIEEEIEDKVIVI